MSDELTPAEQKYFETGGKTDIPGTPEKTEAAAATVVETPVKEEIKSAPAVETKEAAKVEAKVEAPVAEEKKETEPKDKQVSGLLAELQTERERRREESKARQESEKQFVALQARLDTLARLATAQTQQGPQEIPDINTDPVGHFKAKSEMMERQLRETGEWRKQQEQWRQQQEQQSQTVNNIQRLTQLANAHETEFRKTTPDYDEASSYMRDSRDRELARFGIKDPLQRQHMIHQDAINIAAQALADGQNPAEVIYEMAKIRGFQTKAKTAVAAVAAPAAAAVAAVDPAKVVSDELKVAMAAKGQAAGQSIGQVPGAAPESVTLQSIANMTDEEFAEATKGNKWAKLMGGR